MPPEIVEWLQLAIASGALVYIGRIDQKIRFLISRDRDHETRLRELEHKLPNEPSPSPSALRRAVGDD
jgi:hypothetical protein